MDKKAKKRIEVLRKKISQYQVLLSAAKQQPDDPNEPARIEADIAKAEQEIGKLKES